MLIRDVSTWRRAPASHESVTPHLPTPSLPPSTCPTLRYLNWQPWPALTKHLLRSLPHSSLHGTYSLHPLISYLLYSSTTLIIENLNKFPKYWGSQELMKFFLLLTPLLDRSWILDPGSTLRKVVYERLCICWYFKIRIYQSCCGSLVYLLGFSGSLFIW